MEQQKLSIDFSNYSSIRVKLKNPTTNWISNRNVSIPYRLQSLGQDASIVTIEIRQVWNTPRYKAMSTGKITETTIHTAFQRAGITRWLPVIKCPIEFLI